MIVLDELQKAAKSSATLLLNGVSRVIDSGKGIVLRYWLRRHSKPSVFCHAYTLVI